MTHPRASRAPLAWAPSALLAAALALSVTGPALAEDKTPDASPGAPGEVGLPPSPSPGIVLDVVFQPLPPVVVEVPADIPTTSVAPTSGPALELGVPYPYSLGHCGLLTPIDLDGSLWQPVGGVSPSGGAIESDEDIGELINATEGVLTLVDVDAAEFRTAGGSLIELLRAPGALDYPLCM